MATAAVARRELEALLRARKLDRTLADDTAGQAKAPEALPTGIASLDQALGGGWPRGEMSEIAGPRSSGRASLLVATLARITTSGGIAAFVDTLDMFDPASAAAAGVSLDRLLWVRGDATCQAGPAVAGRLSSVANSQDRALDRAVKAVNLVLQAGGFDLVALDLTEVRPEALRRLPFTTWFRLQRTIEGSRTACLLLGAAPTARSTGGISLHLSRRGGPGELPGRGTMPRMTGSAPRPASSTGVWLGGAGEACLLTGLDIDARIVRSKVPDGAVRTVRAVAAETGR